MVGFGAFVSAPSVCADTATGTIAKSATAIKSFQFIDNLRSFAFAAESNSHQGLPGSLALVLEVLHAIRSKFCHWQSPCSRNLHSFFWKI